VNISIKELTINQALSSLNLKKQKHLIFAE